MTIIIYFSIWLTTDELLWLSSRRNSNDLARSSESLRSPVDSSNCDDGAMDNGSRVERLVRLRVFAAVPGDPALVTIDTDVEAAAAEVGISDVDTV